MWVNNLIFPSGPTDSLISAENISNVVNIINKGYGFAARKKRRRCVIIYLFINRKQKDEKRVLLLRDESTIIWET